MIGTQHLQAFLLLLSILTILFFNLYERYIPVGPELLEDTRFTLTTSKWRYSNTGITNSTDGVIRLHSDVYSPDIYVTQSLPSIKNHNLLLLSAETKTQNVSRGQKRWMSARIILLPIKQDDIPIYSTPHNLVNIYGDHEWSQSRKVFKIPETTTKISVSAQLLNVTGTFWVRKISLRAASEKSFYEHLHPSPQEQTGISRRNCF